MNPLPRHVDAGSLVRYAQSTLIVRQLQAVLKAEGQPTSGLKAPLQRRLVTYIDDMARRGDTEGLNRVKNLIYNPDTPAPPRPAAPVGNRPSLVVNGYRSPTMTHTGQPLYPTSSSAQYAAQSSSISRIHFRESPFHAVLAALSKVEPCPAMSAHRSVVRTLVTLSPVQIQQLDSDKSYRCMLYCAVIDGITPFTKDTEITFPHQVELRVNETPITGLNLRGLKNKPGSTRPADITDHLQKKPLYRNEVALTYALTQKRFGFVVNLVKTETVENLVEKLRGGNFIAKETVISDMLKKNEDSDLVATSSIMSLKCPLSTLRIDLPIRSTFCSHVQCFDAKSFLQLQQQAPTWTCPTCSKSVPFKTLVVDRYFEDILKSTPKTVESVTIDVDACWSVAAEASNSPMPDSSDDEDGIIDITDSRVSRVKNEGTPASTSPGASVSRELSTPRVGSVSNKRLASQVIDLTLTDDEEEPLRPIKRPNTMATPSGMSSDGQSGGLHGLDRMYLSALSSAIRSPAVTPDPFLNNGSNRYPGVTH